MNVLSKKNPGIKGGREIKATLCYFISNICSKAFSFLTIPLYTNILTTSEYGYLNTYNAWVGILSVVLGLALSSAIYGQPGKEKKERNRFQSSVLFLSVVSALTIVSFVLGGYILINGRIDVIVILALLQGYATFVINFILQEWVLENRYVIHSITSVSMVAIPIIITCLIITKVFQTQKYMCVIVPRMLVFAVFMIPILIYVFLRGKCFYDKVIWKWSIRYSVPIVFHSLSLTIMLQADRVMISSLYGYEESGRYSFIYNVTLVIGVFIAAVENTWKAWFFKNYENTKKEIIRKKSKLFILITVLGVSVYLLVLPELVKILASEEYQTRIYLAGPIAFAYIISFLYDFLVYVEYKKGVTRNIAQASIIAAIVNIGLNFAIIPVYGGTGAAITTIVSYVVQFIMHLRVVKRLDKELYPPCFFVPYILSGIAAMCMFLLLLEVYVVRYVIAIMLAGVTILVIYKNRRLLI